MNTVIKKAMKVFSYFAFVLCITLSAQASSSHTLPSTSTGSGSTGDWELSPTVTLSSSISTIAEGSDTAITLTTTSSSTSNEDIIVTLSSSGTATDGIDYSAINNSTITISAGSTTGTKTFTITDNSVYEGDETVIVAISGVSGGGGATESGTQSVTITIAENESQPTVSLKASASSVYDFGSDLTITATATQIADEDITVVIDTSGTATEVSDYASISDITITAGATTGTTTFNPLEDTVNEGSEEANVSISSVSGANASASGTTSVTITINEYALRTGTIFTEGSTSSQNAIKAETQWTNVDYSGSASSVHPYEQMNIHKVQSFSDGTNNLTGVGKFIHIADFNCDDDHLVYANKTIVNLDDGGSGESTFSNATSSYYHCQFVASMAAGDGTGDGDGSGENILSGVAPDADLILSSIPNYSGWYATDDYAADLDIARGYGAVASNNSWGLGDNTDGDPNASYNVTEFQSLIDNNPGYSLAQLAAYKFEGSTSNAAVTAVESYITALNNFQNNGVIVFASGNYNGESDVSLVAGLPQFYPQLAEAWLAVGLIDFTGSSVASASESDFTLHGNKCGSAKEYCVVADGYEVNGGGWISSGSHYYKVGASGSSFSAPMISGGIALLSQAFPNHTPEQLTDRLLASSNNDWFTPEGNTTFTTHGNSITHGYHSTWGHGLPDFYAALSPITSNSNPAMALYMGDSIQTSEAVSLTSSSITPSASFGDAIYHGLAGETGYAYDALSGAFKYDMATHVNMPYFEAPSIDLSSELAKLDSQLSVDEKPSRRTNFDNVVSNLYKSDNLETTLTLGASSLPIQSFFDSNPGSSVRLSDYKIPYLEAGDGGIGVGAAYQLSNSRLLIGATVPFEHDYDQKVGNKKTLVGSLEYGDPSVQSITLMAGQTKGNDNLLGLTGTNAFSLEGSSSNTRFTALKTQKQLDDNISLTGMITIATTDMTSPSNSFVNSASNIKSSSFSASVNKKDLFENDGISLNIRQPSLVSDGNFSIRLPSLADSSGNLNYRNKNINLKSTSRQLDYTLSYRKDIEKDISISAKHTMTKNLNHENSSEIAHSSYFGVKYGGLKFGIDTVPVESSYESKLSYTLSF